MPFQKGMKRPPRKGEKMSDVMDSVEEEDVEYIEETPEEMEKRTWLSTYNNVPASDEAGRIAYLNATMPGFYQYGARKGWDKQ